MTADERARLETDVARTEAELERVRAENDELIASYRVEPREGKGEALRHAAAVLAGARAESDAAKVALGLFERTGSPYGLFANDGVVVGTIALTVDPGTGKEERERMIDDELTERLGDLAAELGVVLAATPARFTSERPGRDPEGRTVLDVSGRVEGDRLVPALAKAARTRRR